MNVTALLKTLANLLAGNERTEGGRRGGYREQKWRGRDGEMKRVRTKGRGAEGKVTGEEEEEEE